ncbi:hypothetical protein PYCCODRAFT_612851 [Trametes coccinea BRFM310]|uniref:Uncharacterized protein n=1 Tax=Trametes coccinea (strain BRFM310) TaxID=1353009 RepID=A0A1Y2J3H4_TRAC3|nr:hypothetical protein PYCCODRAFT_612851 [Trametes coccinea BRFM310]
MVAASPTGLLETVLPNGSLKILADPKFSTRDLLSSCWIGRRLPRIFCGALAASTDRTVSQYDLRAATTSSTTPSVASLMHPATPSCIAAAPLPSDSSLEAVYNLDIRWYRHNALHRRIVLPHYGSTSRSATESTAGTGRCSWHEPTSRLQ